MVDTGIAESPERLSAPFSLSAEQLAFFESFGFLRLPGLFKDDIDEIAGAFDELFAAKEFLQYMGRLYGKPLELGGPTGDITQDPPWFETNYDLHFGRDRVTIPSITDRHERLKAVERDPRVLGAVASLLGPDYEVKAADGNLFYCDTSWHADMYGSPLNQFHVKLSLYLDPIDHRSGAIRLIPGTHYFRTPFATRLRQTLQEPGKIEEIYGIAPEEVPSWTLPSEPGDMVVWNYRLIHASFNGGDRRRLLSLNFRQLDPAGEQ